MEIGGMILAGLAALVAIVWLGNYMQRRSYVASLSSADRERLRGFELTGSTWRTFRAIEREAAKGRMYA